MEPDFHKIFEKLSRESRELLHTVRELHAYDPTEGQQIQGPVYVPTPKNYGPQRITIEQYKARNSKVVPAKVEAKKPRSRGGTKVKLNKKIKELKRLIPLAEGEYKRKLYEELKDLTKNW